MINQVDMPRLRAVSLVKVVTNGKTEMTVADLITCIHEAAKIENIEMDEHIEKATLNFLIVCFNLIENGPLS